MFNFDETVDPESSFSAGYFQERMIELYTNT